MQVCQQLQGIATVVAQLLLYSVLATSDAERYAHVVCVARYCTSSQLLCMIMYAGYRYCTAVMTSS
jgi:hypothetical protein